MNRLYEIRDTDKGIEFEEQYCDRCKNLEDCQRTSEIYEQEELAEAWSFDEFGQPICDCFSFVDRRVSGMDKIHRYMTSHLYPTIVWQ